MLRGRRSERRAIDELLDEARTGTSGALILRGEPGIGKTTLLDYAADQAAAPAANRAGARAADPATARAAAPAADPAAASAADQAAGQAASPAVDRGGDWVGDRVSDPAADRASNSTADRAGDRHTAGRTGDRVGDSTEGMRVLRGAGIESEAELPFAGLHMVLSPVLDRMDAVPGPQRAALSAAFGLGGGSAGDRFMIGAGVLSLLAEVAEQGPLLCLIDDAQWLDRASTDALLFAARRLGREGVALILAVRDYAGALDATGIRELRLAGLDADDAAALLTDRGTDLPTAEIERLIAETHGNPLALKELPSLAAAHGPQLGPMPLTSRVQDAFHHQIRALPVAARTMLLLAAAADSGDLPVLLRAATTMDAGIADLQPAEESGLISLSPSTFTFRHPLIRAAVYHGAPLALRLAAHAALATAYEGLRDADRRAWHLAVAATGPEERVADGLERAAARAAARNGHAAAAAGYERAAQLSEDPVAAIRRLTLACEAGTDAGRLDWARARAERAFPDVDDPAIRARLVEVQAAADFAQGSLDHAYELLSSGAAALAEHDPERAFWMRVRAFHAAWAAPTDGQLIARAVDAFDTVDDLMPVAWLTRWGTAVTLERDTSGFPPLDETLARARKAASGPRGLIEIASRSFVSARDEECAEIAAELTARARSAGTVSAVPAGLGLLTLAQVMLGRYREAAISGAEGLSIARDTGQPLWISYTSGALAFLAAVEGDEARCHRHAQDAALDRSAPAGSLAGITWAQAALALLDLGHGRIQEAFDRLQTIAQGPTRHQAAVVRSVPDLIEAAIRLNRPDATAAPLALYTRWAKALDRPWIDALLARCQAMTSRSPEPHYLRALKLQARPFEQARTHLLYGEWLRRSRRKNDAQEHLSAALQTFEDLHSTPWAARARAELSASGATVSGSETPDAFAKLTPQELQITRLAAQGASNRDIAAQLFISPRTVAYHLYKAYPKLGITSRSELAALTA
ncbi:LuxR C-terminal-related transcriptional regulator [Spirillospora sp. NPDC048911]|uniref:helix-turn-helix transcriptional regulator n=1 Tax=Spirillospora sp. NPDC048911 TaxID=3364527 RepID=UPI0037127928